MAYQLAFDLENNATQKYLTKVSDALPDDAADAAQPKFARVKSILSGKETIKLQLEFLCRNNHTDMLILKDSKVRLCSTKSMIILLHVGRLWAYLEMTPSTDQQAKCSFLFLFDFFSDCARCSSLRVPFSSYIRKRVHERRNHQ